MNALWIRRPYDLDSQPVADFRAGHGQSIRGKFQNTPCAFGWPYDREGPHVLAKSHDFRVLVQHNHINCKAHSDCVYRVAGNKPHPAAGLHRVSAKESHEAGAERVRYRCTSRKQSSLRLILNLRAHVSSVSPLRSFRRLSTKRGTLAPPNGALFSSIGRRAIRTQLQPGLPKRLE